MELGLGGKRALVTGSSRGIGEGVAKALAREGVLVVVTGRDGARAAHVANEISAYGRAVPIVGSIDNDEGAAVVAQGAIAAFGGIDILINNAASYGATGWDNITPSNWLARLNNNLVSMVRMIHLLAPAMKQRGWGRLIQMSSTGGTFSGPSYCDYAAAKAGVLSLTVAASREYGRFGITSNAIGCGTIRTAHIEEMMLVKAADKLGGTLDEAERWLSTDGRLPHFAYNGTMNNAVGRFGRIEEVADAICFLASERASYITGANIRVDGGQAPIYNP
jgi:3-oxoacyl-[acyl-carrier protein] reductase